MDARLSVVVLTKNEENNIIDCLESALFADEIIVIDDFSDDRVLELVDSLDNKKIKVFQRKLNNDFSKQRNFGLSKTTGKWIMFLDADERVPEALASEISNFHPSTTLRTEFQISNDINGYYIKRKDIIWGKKLRYGETGNIKLLRLAKRNKGNWRGRVHEEWEVNGTIGELKNELIHYSHQNIKTFLKEINYYTDIRAESLFGEGVKVDLMSVFAYPIGKFFLNYIFKRGFLDGAEGFVFAIMMSFHSFLVRSKLWLLYTKRT